MSNEAKRNRYPFSGGARGAGYDPSIGDDPFNVAVLLRREPTATLRRIAARKGDPRARLAARALRARLNGSHADANRQAYFRRAHA